MDGPTLDENIIQDLVLYSLDIDDLVEEVKQYQWNNGHWIDRGDPIPKNPNFQYRTILRFK